MKGTQFSEERIIGIFKEADCKTSTIAELCRKHGVSDRLSTVGAETTVGFR